MELIVIAILALVMLGGVDRKLHPQEGQGRAAASRRAPARPRRAHISVQRRRAPSHRVSPGQVRPFMGLDPSLRR